MNQTNSTFESMLKAAISRESTGTADTMLINAHLSQMKMFGIRQGVEFYPEQDNFGSQRYDFIKQVIKFNQLDARLDSIWDHFLALGKGLFYIRPTEKTYRLYWFDKDSYRTFYSPEGELEEVVVIYPYKVKSNKGFGGSQVGLSTDKRYMRLRITAETIEETHSEQELSFDGPQDFTTLNKKELTNTLQFIPCVEVFNNPDAFGTDGSGEFDWISNQIVAHDEMVKNIRANLSFFGNPTLLSSRPKQDIVESSKDAPPQRPSISSQSGFTSDLSTLQSTYKQDPTSRNPVGYNGSPGSGMRVPRVIANLEPSDRVGFITPNAVSTDQSRYVGQLRNEIRLALGGIDDISISNVTATEIKSQYGRVSATAKKKCLQIYEYGICKCFELMIFQEEQIFRKTLAQASGIKYPELPVDETPESMEKYNKQKATYEKKLQKAIDLARETKEIPDGVLGLAPDGDRTVAWRWMGPVYEDTAQDKVQQSIFCRNLQELGVDSIEALKYLFPSKTDDEVAGMLSGFPFRMVGQVQRAYSQFLDLINQEMRTPHPQQPDIPMAADPRLDLTPFLYRTLESLQKEVTYAGRYRNADPIGTPTISDPTANLRGSSFTNSSSSSSSGDDSSVGSTSAGSGGTSTTSASPDGYNTSPIRPYTVKPPEQPIGSSSGESIQGRIQPGGRAPEFTSANPLPGSTVSSDTRVRPSELQFPTSSLIQQSGSADIAAFEREQPGILQQLFPNFAGNQRPATPRKRGKSRKS
jgi:hypothetical protein